LSDVTLETLVPLYESARIKPAVVQVESHPYLPETELLEYCKEKKIILLAFAPLGHGMRPGPLEDPVVLAIAERVKKTPAQVLLAWALQRGTTLLTTPALPPGRKRILTSRPCRKMRLMRSVAFKPGSGLIT
jgi:aldehyde reductase